MKESPDKVELQYGSLFKNMPSGMAYHRILKDKDGKSVDYVFLEVNKAFAKLMGFKRENIIGKKATQVFPSIKDSIFNWIDFYGKVATAEKEITFEQYIKELNRWYLVSVHSHKKGYFSTIYIDITKRKKAEESLRQAYDTLKETQNQLIQTEKMQVVGRLASGVAHEVKNPLAIILQGVDYLSSKLRDPEEDVRFALDSMIEAVTRANNIINDLLNFSRLSDMKMSEESLNSVIEDSLLLVKTDIEYSNIEVAKNFGDIPKTSLDKNRIQQVFINIFMNAIHAMDQGGELTIKTYSKKLKDESAIIVEIEDTGPGIPGDVLGKIFDPFFTTSKDSKGTGLGLSIARNIIEMHNGEINIENRKDRSGVIVKLEFKL